MSERSIVRVTCDEIGAGGPCQALCDWCLTSAVCYSLLNGDGLCQECAELASEVGEGTMQVAAVTQAPRSTDWQCEWDGRPRHYVFEPPLRLSVAVEHDDEGHRWLRADPADADVAAALALGADKRTGVDLTLTGADRADLCANIAGWLHFVLDCWQHDLACEEPWADQDDAAANERERAQARAGLDWCREHVRLIPQDA